MNGGTPQAVDQGATTDPDFSEVGFRAREMEWCRKNRAELRAFAGQWVIVDEEAIVAHGNKPVELIEAARRQGIGVPYIFFVEGDDSETIKIGL
jgi:hypothetical protein